MIYLPRYYLGSKQLIFPYTNTVVETPRSLSARDPSAIVSEDNIHCSLSVVHSIVSLQAEHFPLLSKNWYPNKFSSEVFPQRVVSMTIQIRHFMWAPYYGSDSVMPDASIFSPCVLSCLFYLPC